MPSLDIPIETSLAPEEIRRRLTDFTPDRPKIWPGLAPDLYEVYEVRDTTAVVKEGSHLPPGLFWARERYDWSDPARITWTVEESNFCTPGDYLAATLNPREDGGTHIVLHWERRPTTFRARFACFMVVLTRGKLVADSFRKGLN